MRLYLDTEFDGHGGELISLALAAEDGKHWYGVWPSALNVKNAWVREHVVPYTGAFLEGAVNIRPGGFYDINELRYSLAEYLRARPHSVIYADWPDDFVHLMQLMSGPEYGLSWMVPCTMVLLNESEPKPDVPHNALSDAIALMRWHIEQGKVDRTDDRPNST